MSKKLKFYAVKVGVEPGIYYSWDECLKQVNGVPNAVYKSFKTESEAHDYLNDSIAIIDETSVELTPDEINAAIELELDELDSTSSIAFVDGTFTSKNVDRAIGGFGVVIISENRKLIPYYKSFVDPVLIKLGNVAGEILGAIDAIEWAIDNKKKKLKIYYDFEGIEKWATGVWKAKIDFTKDYVNFINSVSKKITIQFQKVKSHSGIKYNELADEYASKITGDNQSYSTHKDGNILYRGHLFNTVQKWTEIIESININFDTSEKIVFETSEDKKREYVVYMNLRKGKDKVRVSIYKNSAYVQGKKSELFYIVNAEATSLLESASEFIENLSLFSPVSISESQVNEQFSILLPDFLDNGDSKLLSSLKGAIFNTLVEGYMPEYTGLLFYSIKLTDYYLHRIIGDKLNLPTTNKHGANCFNYFNYDQESMTWITKPSVNTSLLTPEQLTLLLELVHFFKMIRHSSIHWNKDSMDTRSFDTLEEAKDYVLDSLTLFNKYYILFP